MDLPRLVVDRILLHLTDVDALYSAHMARFTLRTVIRMCPQEWRREQRAEFVTRHTPARKQDPPFDPRQHRIYLLSCSVAKDIEATCKGRKRANMQRFTKMRMWLLNKYGSATAWKAAQVVALLKNPGSAWTARTLMMAMPDVIEVLAKDLKVPDAVLTRLQSVDKQMRKALMAGEASPTARKRLSEFLIGTAILDEDEWCLLRRHVLSGDDIAAEQEYLDLAIEKLAALTEDAAGMRELLGELGPDRADIVIGFAREVGMHLIARELQVPTVAYLKSSHTLRKQARCALLNQIGDHSDAAKWRMVPDSLEASGINIEDQERADAWLESVCIPWNNDGDPDNFLWMVKEFQIFREALAADDIEPTFTPDGRADIMYDGVSLRCLAHAVWSDVGRMISERDFSQAAKLCQTVFGLFLRLRGALRACGMEYRYDSELCRAYVEYDEGDVDDIVRALKR